MLKRKLLLLMLFITLLIAKLGIVFLCRCTFKAPSKPMWDLNFIIPLINKTFKMEELAEDTEELTIDSLNNKMIFTINQEIETFQVNESMGVDGVRKDKQVPLGSTVFDSVGLPDSIIVEEAIIKKGRTDLRIQNLLSNDVEVMVTLPDLYSQGGDSLYIRMIIPPGGTDSQGIPLNGFQFRPPVRGDRSYIRFRAGVNKLNGIVNPGDQINIDLEISDLVFSSVSGWLNEVEIPIDSIDTDMPIPEELEGFKIGTTDLKLALWFGFNIPIKIDFLIEALETRSGYPEPIHIDTLIIPTQGMDADTIYIPDVADFINSHPEKILISGSVKLGDGFTHAVVTEEDSIKGSVIFRSPLIFTLPSRTNKTEVDTIEIEEDTRDIIRDNIRELAIEADIENHLPIGAEVSLFFSKEKSDSTIYQDPNSVIIGPIGLANAVLEGDTAVVKAPGYSTWNQVLTKENELTLFEEEEIYYGFQLIFQGTQGKMAKVRPSDYIHIRAHGSAKLRTKIPEEDNEKEGSEK